MRLHNLDKNADDLSQMKMTHFHPKTEIQASGGIPSKKLTQKHSARNLNVAAKVHKGQKSNFTPNKMLFAQQMAYRQQMEDSRNNVNTMLINQQYHSNNTAQFTGSFNSNKQLMQTQY